MVWSVCLNPVEGISCSNESCVAGGKDLLSERWCSKSIKTNSDSLLKPGYTVRRGRGSLNRNLSRTLLSSRQYLYNYVYHSKGGAAIDSLYCWLVTIITCLVSVFSLQSKMTIIEPSCTLNSWFWLESMMFNF